MSKYWVNTWTGGRVDFVDTRPEQIDIRDIAHQLSLQARWCGATETAYSVAQHSVYVSLRCAPESALWGLMHDAPEAYTSDIPTPLKRLLGKALLVVESRLALAVAEQFGLPKAIASNVLANDQAAAIDEGWHLLGKEPHELALANTTEHCAWLPRIKAALEAEESFLRRFEALTGERVKRFVKQDRPFGGAQERRAS